MPFPSTSVLDDFNRANGALGANWAGNLFGPDADLAVDSNQAKGPSNPANNGWATQFGPDCEAWMEITTYTGHVNVVGRWSALDSTTPDGYMVAAQSDVSEIVIYRFDDGSFTELATFTQTVSSGDWLGMRIVGDTIYAYYKDVSVSSEWQLVGQVTDGTYSSAGYIGLYHASSTTFTDNFGGGDYVPESSPPLWRGRSFPFFDDDQLNRFEFWPAVAIGATLERSASLSATGSIASAGQSFSVFERNTAVSATGTIAVTGSRIVERSAALNASATVTVAGARVVDRAATVDAAATISTSAQSFTVFGSSASLSASASITSSAASFSVFERSSALSASAAVEGSGERVVDRAASVTATVTIATSAQSLSIFERAIDTSASALISTTAESFSILERQVVINGQAFVLANGQTDYLRQSALSAAASISVAGGVVGGVFEFERSAAVDASGVIAVSGVVIRERATSLSATATITTSRQAELARSAAITAVAGITTGGIVEHERSVAVNATGLITSTAISYSTIERATGLAGVGAITVSGSLGSVFNPRNLFNTSPESRILGVSRESRAVVISRERRT